MTALPADGRLKRKQARLTAKVFKKGVKTNMPKGAIYSIAVSPERGQLKKEVPEAEVIENYGIKNDGHAGSWGRQVTCLSRESVLAALKEHNIDIAPGDFAENIQITGLDLSSVKPGARLKLGDSVVLEVTQIGKEDHPSIVTKTFGISLLPGEGLFCRVLCGGVIKKGDPAEII